MLNPEVCLVACVYYGTIRWIFRCFHTLWTTFIQWSLFPLVLVISTVLLFMALQSSKRGVFGELSKLIKLVGTDPGVVHGISMNSFPLWKEGLRCPHGKEWTFLGNFLMTWDWWTWIWREANIHEQSIQGSVLLPEKNRTASLLIGLGEIFIPMFWQFHS